MDAQLRAIADPTRREILELVSKRECTAGEIAERFEMTRPGVSQHIQVLVGVGLLSLRQEATRKYYRANAQGLMLLQKQLDEFWRTGLADLKRLAERDKGKKQ